MPVAAFSALIADTSPIRGPPSRPCVHHLLTDIGCYFRRHVQCDSGYCITKAAQVITVLHDFGYILDCQPPEVNHSGHNYVSELVDQLGGRHCRRSWEGYRT